MKIVIGIVTHQRPHKVLRLLKQLNLQLPEQTQVWILENGPQQLSNHFIHLINSNFLLIYNSHTSIPKARNTLFEKAKKTHDFLIFLDDDVILPPHWFSKMYKQIAENHDSSTVIQGNFHSFPKTNIYAQTTEILNQLWLRNNTYGNSYTHIIDTKHVVLPVHKMKSIHQLFDPRFTYASDIGAAAILATQHNFKIKFAQDLYVFHQERAEWGTFVKHRFRLSRSFRTVSQIFPGFFNSESISTKFLSLWQILPQPRVMRLWIILNLFVIYGCVWVSNKITAFLRS